MHVELEELSVPARRALDPNAPKPLREMAARGIVPGLPAAEIVSVVVALHEAEDTHTRDTARATLAQLPAAILAGALAADDLAAQVDAMRERIDVIANLSVVEEANRWSILHSTTRLMASVTAAAEKASLNAVPIVEWVVPATMSSVEIALVLYNDRDRAGEISQRNPVPNPLFYPAGAVLSVLAE